MKTKRKTMKTLLFLLLAAASYAQPFATHVLISTRTGVTSDKVTIAQDQTLTGPPAVQLTDAVILATVTGTVRFEHSGTAPTTTLAVPTPMPGGSAAKALGYTASNVGAGTVVSVEYPLTANVPYAVDMRNLAFVGKRATNNITVVVTLGSSGNVSTAVYYREF